MYQGHHCWNCWNVSLWIANEYGLYRAAVDCLRRPRGRGRPVTLSIATRRFMALVGEQQRTPDGARYTATAVRRALAGIAECL